MKRLSSTNSTPLADFKVYLSHRYLGSLHVPEHQTWYLSIRSSQTRPRHLHRHLQGYQDL